MKRIARTALALAVVLTMTVACAACSKKDGTDKLVCGITKYEPMNYMENNQWTGFDTEFALLVGEKLGIPVEFQEIKWENRYSELAAGTINCIWNGFTANSTDDDGQKRSDKVDFSYSYMLNQQCVVIKAENAAQYTKLEDLVGKTVAAEKGSAGEAAAAAAAGSDGEIVDCTAQTDTFTEVLSGAADCAVVDILLAEKRVGTGNFSTLAIADITMESEVYAVGFAKGSALRDKVNEAIVALFAEGEMAKLSEKYHLENNLKLDKNFNG